MNLDLTKTYRIAWLMHHPFDTGPLWQLSYHLYVPGQGDWAGAHVIEPDRERPRVNLETALPCAFRAVPALGRYYGLNETRLFTAPTWREYLQALLDHPELLKDCDGIFVPEIEDTFAVSANAIPPIMGI